MSPTLQGTYPLRRLAWDEAMLKLCGAPVPILHSLDTLPLPSPPLSSPPLPSPNSHMQAMAKEPAECPPEALDSEDMLFLLYTSGSTGKPKGVVHTQAGYLLYASLTHEVCVCASVHVSVCMSELCGVCHPCVLSWCLTVTRGTSMRVWLTLAGSPATHMWSTVPSAMESPLFCLRALHSIQTQVRGVGRELEEGGEGTRGEREGGRGREE